MRRRTILSAACGLALLFDGPAHAQLNGSHALGDYGVINVDSPNKHRLFALGPDVTLPVASKSKLFALVDLRYMWEMDARVKTQGRTFVITTSIPIPSVKLPTP